MEQPEDTERPGESGNFEGWKSVCHQRAVVGGRVVFAMGFWGALFLFPIFLYAVGRYIGLYGSRLFDLPQKTWMSRGYYFLPKD